MSCTEESPVISAKTDRQAYTVYISAWALEPHIHIPPGLLTQKLSQDREKRKKKKKENKNPLACRTDETRTEPRCLCNQWEMQGGRDTQFRERRGFKTTPNSRGSDKERRCHDRNECRKEVTFICFFDIRVNKGQPLVSIKERP